jgi:hypothetical protein
MTDTQTTTAVNPRTLRKQTTGTGKIASREWIDRSGNVVEDEAEATGFKYTLLADPSRPFVYQADAKLGAGETDTMLACFGGLTLAGNIVNSTKAGEDPIQNIKDRFDLLDTGVWVNREGGFGPRYDHQLLAECIAEVKGHKHLHADYKAKMDTSVLIEGKQVRYPTAAMRNKDVAKLYESRKPKKEVAAPSLDSL